MMFMIPTYSQDGSLDDSGSSIPDDEIHALNGMGEQLGRKVVPFCDRCPEQLIRGNGKSRMRAPKCNAAWECPPFWGRATDAREKESPLPVYDPKVEGR
ncbi:hypothetical protein CRG98_038858 [Punica granatum]|uniref:Uncharacterized protein n=1 Tax=Punica granatum TaxID=22663 RepID=A0A2I0I9T1_PUNGR|nr:hypothetical protein CRG98_038858 [Punica granatum]